MREEAGVVTTAGPRVGRRWRGKLRPSAAEGTIRGRAGLERIQRVACALLAGVLVGVLVAGCSERAERDSGPVTEYGSEPTIDEVPGAERAYLDAALTVLRDHYHGASRVDWEELQRVAYDRLATTPTRGGAYIAISAVLGLIGDGHNGLTLPAAASQPGAEAGALPEVGRSKHRLITIALPPVSPHHDTHHAYAARTHAAVEALHDDGVCGWVVDLRGNTGGSMYPMLAAVASLLADQQVMSFVDPVGGDHSDITFDEQGNMLIDGTPAVEAQRWRGDEGDETIAGALAAVEDVPKVGRGDPVAVLTDGRTASAAEAVAVAFEGRHDTRRFGSATWGVPTSPSVHELGDGAVLQVAEHRMVDRNGVAHDRALQPDVAAADPAERAVSWLLGTEACQDDGTTRPEPN